MCSRIAEAEFNLPGVLCTKCYLHRKRFFACKVHMRWMQSKILVAKQNLHQK